MGDAQSQMEGSLNRHGAESRTTSAGASTEATRSSRVASVEMDQVNG